ncbi:MAG: aminopeptidase N C-terminal domain-containing protein, partial [Acidithiobacillus sp.]
RYDAPRQQAMGAALKMLASKPKLSRDLAEVIQRSHPGKD